VKFSILALVFGGLILSVFFIKTVRIIYSQKLYSSIVLFLFPLRELTAVLFFALFGFLRILNLASMVLYRFPVTTVLAFNLGLAFTS